MGKTLAELALTSIAALGIFGSPYVGAQPATHTPAELQAPKAPEQAPQKYPLPSDADLKKAEKDIRDVYSAEYKLTDPAKKQEFANKLLEQAGQIKNGSDLPTKCVLLRESYLMFSQQTKTLDSAFKAADVLARSYDGVDSIELKSTALETSRKASKTPEDLELLANKYVTVIDESINDNKYDPATAMVKQFKPLAQALKNTDLIQKATDYEKKILLLKAEYTIAAKALETLNQNPADPAANLTYGKFLCGKGDWEKAIDYFAKSADTDLKDAATQEMSVKTFSTGNSDAYVKLGETWEKIAKKSNKVDAERFNGRAVEWYQNALSEMTNPIAKAKLEKKLSELEAKGAAKNGGWVDLLSIIDPQRDAINGKWAIKNRVIISDDSEYAKLQIPYQPSEEYDFKIVFSRVQGNDVVAQMMSKANRQFMWGMGWDGDKLFAFGKIGETSANNNPTSVQKSLKGKQKCTSLVMVRNDGIKAQVDGQLITEYKTNFKDLDIYPSWGTKDVNSMGVGSFKSPTEFYEIQIRELKGKGKRLR